MTRSRRTGLINVTHITDLGPACECGSPIWGYERIDHESIWAQCGGCHRISEISCPRTGDTEAVVYYSDTHAAAVQSAVQS